MRSTNRPRNLAELRAARAALPPNAPSGSDAWSFFCPLCHAPRRLPFRPGPVSARQIAQISIVTAMFTVVAWPWFGWKGIVSGVAFWAVFELVYRGRMRALLNCTQCGFDPYLYLVDLKRARLEIDQHWRRKFAEKGVPFPEKPSAAGRVTPATEPPASPRGIS